MPELENITLQVKPEILNRAEEARKEKLKKQITTYSIIGGVVVLVIAYFYFKRKK